MNVNQEDLQMFLAAAEELRIKGLSQASNDSKLEKLDNSVPKIKQASGGSNTNSTSNNIANLKKQFIKEKIRSS